MAEEWAQGAFPPELKLGEHVFAITFHPNENILATGDMTGATKIWKYSPRRHEMAAEDKGHRGSSRALAFAPDGKVLFSGSSDKTIRTLDVVSGQIGWTADAQCGVNCLLCIDDTALASGDDDGCIRLWDTRQRKEAFTIECHEDYVSEMILGVPGQLLSTSGDGTLGVFDFRKRGKRIARSEHQESDLLCLTLAKNNTKVVVGTGAGELGIFSYGDWGDITDRFPGHPDSVDSLAMVDDDIVCTASNDGLIRAIRLFPNKLIGVVGDHGGDPVEMLALDHSKAIMGSCAHDGTVRFWNMRFLLEEDAEGDGGGMDIGIVKGEESSEEEWEDMDGVEEEKEEGDGGGDGRGKERDFFADL